MELRMELLITFAFVKLVGARELVMYQYAIGNVVLCMEPAKNQINVYVPKMIPFAIIC